MCVWQCSISLCITINLCYHFLITPSLWNGQLVNTIFSAGCYAVYISLPLFCHYSEIISVRHFSYFGIGVQKIMVEGFVVGRMTVKHKIRWSILFWDITVLNYRCKSKHQSLAVLNFLLIIYGKCCHYSLTGSLWPPF